MLARLIVRTLPSPDRRERVGWGTCFVVVGIIVELPCLARPVRLPVIARLWRPKTGPPKVELASSMIRLLRVCLNRPLHVVADAVAVS